MYIDRRTCFEVSVISSGSLPSPKKELALGQADEKIALEADKNIPTLRRRNPKDSIVLLWSWHYCRLYQ